MKANKIILDRIKSNPLHFWIEEHEHLDWETMGVQGMQELRCRKHGREENIIHAERYQLTREERKSGSRVKAIKAFYICKSKIYQFINN